MHFSFWRIDWNSHLFYVLKIKTYVNFQPLVHSTAGKMVCISMTNPHWASTQTFKSKVGISNGEFSIRGPSSPPPRWRLPLHLIDTSLIVDGLFKAHIHCITGDHIMGISAVYFHYSKAVTMPVQSQGPVLPAEMQTGLHYWTKMPS